MRRNGWVVVPPKPPSICGACWRGPCAVQFGLFHAPIQLDENRNYHAGGYTYFLSKSRLKRGAAAGCAWCYYLLRYMHVKTLFREEIKKVKQRSVYGWKITVGSHELRFCTPTNAQILELVIDRNLPRSRVVHTSADDPAAPCIVARDPILDVGSSRALSLAKALVDECVHGHERCIRISPAADVRLPARLVDCTDTSRPRLVSTEGELGKYLALSYVWGEPQPHQTTTRNISTYAKRINVSLPQTIRDAIYVTHALGFQYLWTDSLCIVQDSSEDKLHELAHMHLVYRHAYLTIIAASAERVSDGFLEDRSPPLDPEDYLTLPIICPPHPHNTGGSIASVQQVGEMHTTPIVVDAGNTVEHLDADEWLPINTRGWCLQEFYMSPRAILFTSVTLQFKCQGGRQNIGNSLQTTKNDFWLPDVLFYPDPPAPERGSLDWSMIHGRWGDMVHQYSTRKLSEASDKLVACGALAEAFHRVLSSDYLAGLWRDTLLHDLLWRRAPDAMSITDLARPAEYRAPSWSWASVDGPVSMPPWDYGADVTTVADIVRCEVKLKDPELQFGELRGASIVLRAALIPFKLKPDKTGWGEEVWVPPPPREPLSGVHDFADEANTTLEDRMITGRYDFDRHADGTVEGGRRWLIPLLQKGRPGQMSEGSCLIVALAIPDSWSEAKSKRAYQRIGIFDAESGGWDALRFYMALVPLAEIELV